MLMQFLLFANWKPLLFRRCHYFYFLVSTNVSLFISIIISTGAPERSIQNMCPICMCMLFVLFARSRITAISTDLLFLLFRVDVFVVITTFSQLLLFQLEFMILFRWNINFNRRAKRASENLYKFASNLPDFILFGRAREAHQRKNQHYSYAVVLFILFVAQNF